MTSHHPKVPIWKNSTRGWTDYLKHFFLSLSQSPPSISRISKEKHLHATLSCGRANLFTTDNSGFERLGFNRYRLSYVNELHFALQSPESELALIYQEQRSEGPTDHGNGEHRPLSSPEGGLSATRYSPEQLAIAPAPPRSPPSSPLPTNTFLKDVSAEETRCAISSPFGSPNPRPP